MKKVLFSAALALTAVALVWFWAGRTTTEEVGTTTSEPPRKRHFIGVQAQRQNDFSSEWTAFADPDEVFTNRALPVFRDFLRRLGSIGMSPLDPALSTNVVVPFEAGSNRYVLECKFIVDGKWVGLYCKVPDTDLTKPFEGITDFWQTGLENPYRSVSSGDTNQLAALARTNPMTEETARILLTSALGAMLKQPVGPPEAIAQKYYGYEMGRWSGRWWKPGKDHRNQLNVGYEMVVQVRNPTQAVVVVYGNGTAGIR